MKTTLLLSSAALFVCSANAQQPRDPNHPLPPTASSIQSTAPQLPATREAGNPGVQAAPVSGQQFVQRRSARRPDGKVPPTLNNVQFDRPLAGGSLWAIGHGWKASFDGQGFEFIPFLGSQAPRNFPLRVELDQVTIGGQALALPAGEPTQVGYSVRTQRGGVTEVIDTNLLNVEQSFVFDTLPNRGAIKVEVRLAGEFAAASTADGLRFTNEHGGVSYEKAIAVDAKGRQLALPIVWTGSEAHIEIPAAFVEQAQLPLVLDPLLGSITNIGTGALAAEFQRDADVATLQSPARACVIWRRQWSATDQDVWAQLVDDASAPIGSAFTIDFTGLDWLAPAVAGNQNSQGFLCVSEVRSGTLYYIAGRRIDGVLGAVNGAQFDIERDGVVGLTGNNFRPDVGGDFFPGTAAYYSVVFEKEVAPGNRDIYIKLVRQDGTLLTTNPSVIDNATTDESNPCISKQNGNAAYWFVAYQRTWPTSPFDQEVLGKFVLWSGAVQTANPYIAGTLANETAPATSSPVDVEGTTYWMVTYEDDFQVAAGQRDIICKVYNLAGVLQTNFNLSQNEAAGAAQSRDQSAPDVDSDGVRFVVGYSEPYPSSPNDFETKVSTLAWLPATTTMRIEEERVGLGLSVNDEYGTRICSFFSGGGQSSPFYVISDANWGTNLIELYAYGGYTTGSQFNFYASACGAPVSITPTGTTAVGGTVTITVQNGAFSGTVFGYPGFIPLGALGCNCVLGVNNGLLFGNPLVWTVPGNPAFVGTTLSVQGWTALGTNCLGFIDLSDTVDFTIR